MFYITLGSLAMFLAVCGIMYLWFCRQDEKEANRAAMEHTVKVDMVS